MTTILLTRHGQTDWNREDRFRGRADIPLNADGERQAVALAERLATFPISAVYSAPLQRARRTAEICAAPLGLDAQVLPGLLDLDYGEWQGLRTEEVIARDPDLYRLWLTEPASMRFPGGETLAEMQSRCVPVLEEVIARHPADTVAIVGHVTTNRALLLAVLGLGLERYWTLRQDTCCLNILRWPGDGSYELVTLNDTCHMDGVA